MIEVPAGPKGAGLVMRLEDGAFITCANAHIVGQAGERTINGTTVRAAVFMWRQAGRKGNPTPQTTCAVCGAPIQWPDLQARSF